MPTIMQTHIIIEKPQEYPVKPQSYRRSLVNAKGRLPRLELTL